MVKANKIVNDALSNGTLSMEHWKARANAAIENAAAGHAEEALDQLVIELAAEIEREKRLEVRADG